MTKRLYAFLAVLLLGSVPVRHADAQQLYLSKLDVGDGGWNWCANNESGSMVTHIGNSVAFSSGISGNVWEDSSLIEFERPQNSYPGACLALCANVQCVVSTTTGFGIDELTFEIFKFSPGANALDPASTPPIRTMSLYNIGVCSGSAGLIGQQQNVGTYCTAWDGAYNLSGIFGKTNGQYGFRATVKTNQVSATAGNINVSQTAAYPGQNQIPIQIDVTNIHVVQSTPTIVGKTTPVAALPYNITYRLSKDAAATINIYDGNTSELSHRLIRTVISSQPRTGEGALNGTLTNGDYWDGRDYNGNLMPAGVYIAKIDAESNDIWTIPATGADRAWPAMLQIAVDPLQVTDVGLKPLGASSTDMAVISYMLTEPAVAEVDIYAPGTFFNIDLNASPPEYGVNQSPPGTPLIGSDANPGNLYLSPSLREMMEQKESRKSVSTLWDGRDKNGVPVCDGNYVYALYAALPSTAAVGGWVWTTKTQVGVLPVSRGQVISFISPSSTVIGSSPAVAGLDPFYFRYTPSRDATTTFSIKDMAGNLVRKLTNRATRAANFSNREMWDGKDDSGRYVSSGTYLAELISEDPYQCPEFKTSTMTVLFPVDMFRITEVKATPLLGGASETATITFEMSQTMFMELNVYAPDVVIKSSDTWPPVLTSTIPIYTASGMRPGRFKITEYWDGRDAEHNMMPDGRYPFTLVAHTTGTAQIMYATDKIYGYLDVARGKIDFLSFDVVPSVPVLYNSSDTTGLELPPYAIDYMVTRQSSVTVQVLNGANALVAEVAAGVVREGGVASTDIWDGRCTNTSACPNYGFVPQGEYLVKVNARDIGVRLIDAATVQQFIYVNPFRIYDVAITPLTQENLAAISYQVSEPMKVVTKIYRPGTNLGACTTLADGGLGCASRMVKMIIGVRPARTQISEYWDGTDLTLSKVPDGNYAFRVYGTTSTEGVNMLTGAVPSVTVAEKLEYDILVANGPVGNEVQMKDIFFAPNPYTCPDNVCGGWFNIPRDSNSELRIRIYNLAGDLIQDYHYGPASLGDGQSVKYYWPRTNSAGNVVAPGVYLALIRVENLDGGKVPFQTVKKILVP
jgi:flagellar hook assembly protein FlgD